MKITEIYIYPIKSLRPVSVPRARLRPEGPEHDRRFMLLRADDEAAGRYTNIQVVSFPECALFHQEIDGGDIVIAYRGAPKKKKGGGDERDEKEKKESVLHVPLRPEIESLHHHHGTVEVKLFGSAATAYRMGERYDAWFSARFGFRVILVYIGDSKRPVLAHSPNNAPRANKNNNYEDVATTKPKQGWLSSLASYVTGDGYAKQRGREQRQKQERDRDFLTFNEAAPFLVTSRASLRDVSGRLPRGEEVSMINFRPNIVVGDDVDDDHHHHHHHHHDGEGNTDINGSSSTSTCNGTSTSSSSSTSTPLEAWEEDYWAELLIGGGGGRGSSSSSSSSGGARLALTANCARCRSINVDYETGRPAEGERGSVLKKLMRDRRVDSGNKWAPIFGRYAFLLLTPAAGAQKRRGDSGQREEGEEERGEDEEDEDDEGGFLAVAATATADIAVGDEVVVTRRVTDRDVWNWPKTS